MFPRRAKMHQDVAKTPQGVSRPGFWTILDNFVKISGGFWENFGRIFGSWLMPSDQNFQFFLYVSRRPNIFSRRIPRRIQYTSKTSRRRNQDASKGWIIWRCWSDFSSSGGCCIGVGRFWEDFPVIAKISPRRFKMPRDVEAPPGLDFVWMGLAGVWNNLGRFWEDFAVIVHSAKISTLTQFSLKVILDWYLIAFASTESCRNCNHPCKL